MRAHRFIINQKLVPGKLIVRDLEIINQWRNVLRFTPGQVLVLTDGRGRDAQAMLVDYINDAAVVTIERVDSVSKEMTTNVTLYCALLKKENFELVCQKATEIGVQRIVPVITERTIKLGINEDRIVKIITEAVEQSGQSIVPSFGSVLTFDQALAECGALKKIIFDMSGDNMQTPEQGASDIAVMIGPEGGFTNKELEQAKNTGWHMVSLGITTLRGETAAIIASYLAVHQGC